MINLLLCFVKCMGNPKIKKKNSRLKIRFGSPVLEVTYDTIKCLTGVFYVITLVNIIYSFKLLNSAIKVRNSIGFYINMVSEGDGAILPLLQAVPCFLFLLVNFTTLYLVFRVHGNKDKQPKLNWIMYGFIIIGVCLIGLILFIMVAILAHSYGAHESLISGIVDSMKNYSTDPVVKSRIDRMQIDLQCCGSKKYDEWYALKWFDPKFSTKGKDASKSSTPFSCCAIDTLFPCIHIDIEETGHNYLYTPEYNLSISTTGCYESIRSMKQSVGWGIIGKLFLYMFLQIFMLICLRFLQTGHFEKSRFEGRSRTYIIWLFGMFTGNMKKSSSKIKKEPPTPPEFEDTD